MKEFEKRTQSRTIVDPQRGRISGDTERDSVHVCFGGQYIDFFCVLADFSNASLIDRSLLVTCALTEMLDSRIQRGFPAIFCLNCSGFSPSSPCLPLAYFRGDGVGPYPNNAALSRMSWNGFI